MISKDSLEKQLANIRVKRLTAAEKDRQRNYLLTNLPPQQARAKWFLLLNTRAMVQIILAILIVLGGSIATVKAADSAKPGDLLFPLDRAWEEVRIALAPASKKTELELEFAQERVKEVASLVDELSPSSTSAGSQSGVDSSATPTAKFATPTSAVIPPGEGQKKLERALAVTWQQLLEVKGGLSKDQQELIQPLLDELAGVLQALPAGSRLKVEVDKGGQEVEIEVKGDDGKRQVEFKIEKDGKKVKIESSSNESEDDYSDDHQSDDQDSSTDESDQTDTNETLLGKIEVKIKTNKSEIEIKWNNGREEKLELNKTSLSDLLSYLAEKYNIPPEEIKAKWKIEYEESPDHSFDQSDDDQYEEDEHSSKDKEGSGPSSTSTASRVYSIEVKVEGSHSKIEVKAEQGEEKIYSDLTDYEQLVDWLAARYQMSKEEIKNKMKFEVEDDKSEDHREE